MIFNLMVKKLIIISIRLKIIIIRKIKIIIAIK